MVYTRAIPAGDAVAEHPSLAACETHLSTFDSLIRQKLQGEVKLRRHRFEVMFPDCCRLGVMRATVRWANRDTEGPKLEKTCEEVVNPGILLSSRICFVDESVGIYVVSSSELTDPHVEIVDRSTAAVVERVVLEPRGEREGGAVGYQARYQVKPEHPFSLKARVAGGAANLNAPSFDVYFARSTTFQTPVRRLPIFVQEVAPDIIQHLRGTDGGRIGFAERRFAFRYECRQNALDNAGLRWEGCVGIRAGDEFTPIEGIEDLPRFKVGSERDPAGSELQGEGTAPPEPMDRYWPFRPAPGSEYVDLFVQASIAHIPAEKWPLLIDEEPQSYATRLHFEARDPAGNAVYRVINEPVYVEVTTFSKFCRPFIVGTVAFLVVLALAVSVLIWFRRMVTPPSSMNGPQPEVPADQSDETETAILPVSGGSVESALHGARVRAAQTIGVAAPGGEEAGVLSATPGDFARGGARGSLYRCRPGLR